MTVKLILQQKGGDVFTLAPTDSIEQATKELATRKVGALVVSDESQAILGILSERDIVRAVARMSDKALDEPVSALMTKNVTTCTEATTVTELMSLMTEGRFRHLPVERDGKLIGIISIGDVVKRRIADIEQEAEQIKAYIAAV
ncbi:MAG: CBS domain-containing protein [Ahrensia sp.]